MKLKRIGIVGTRRRHSPAAFAKIEIAFFRLYHEGDMIISGGCPEGGDQFAEKIAEKHDIPIAVFKANWGKYGRGAGYKRNAYIAAHSTHLIACVADDRKGGTEDTIRRFRRLHPNFPVILVTKKGRIK